MKNIVLAMAVLAALLFPHASSAASSAERLASGIEREIIAATPWEGAEVEVTGIELPGFSPASDAFDDFSVRIPARMRNTGKVSVHVSLFRNGIEVKSFWASARISVYRDAVVALSPLRMNQRITPADLRLVRIEMNEAYGAASSIEDVAGMVARRPVAPGQVVKEEFLKHETVIKRGERVTVIFDSSGIRLKSAAVAVEDGFKGSVITAKTSAGREITGRVRGRGVMVVGF